jgi:hypothetical protein
LVVATVVLALVAAAACSGAAASGGPSDGDSQYVTGIGTIPTAPEDAEKDESRAQPRFEPTASQPVANIGPAVSAPTSSPATPDCVLGWSTPAPGTPEFTDPLGIIRRAVVGAPNEFVVVDMRMFDGPESPPTSPRGDVAGYLQNVTRWYIKLAGADDPTAFQGRFLVEQRTFGRGLSAAAAFGTHGWRSPDWAGFQLDTVDTKARTYRGLPGRWRGISYDFVDGGHGLTIPGIPDEVVGCLQGT